MRVRRAGAPYKPERCRRADVRWGGWSGAAQLIRSAMRFGRKFLHPYAPSISAPIQMFMGRFPDGSATAKARSEDRVGARVCARRSLVPAYPSELRHSLSLDQPVSACEIPWDSMHVCGSRAK
jgi:hypothetical protein